MSQLQDLEWMHIEGRDDHVAQIYLGQIGHIYLTLNRDLFIQKNFFYILDAETNLCSLRIEANIWCYIVPNYQLYSFHKPSKKENIKTAVCEFYTETRYYEKLLL